MTQEELVLNGIVIGTQIQKDIHDLVLTIINENPKSKYQDAFNTALMYKLGQLQAEINELKQTK